MNTRALGSSLRRTSQNRSSIRSTWSRRRYWPGARHRGQRAKTWPAPRQPDPPHGEPSGRALGHRHGLRRRQAAHRRDQGHQMDAEDRRCSTSPTGTSPASSASSARLMGGGVYRTFALGTWAWARGDHPVIITVDGPTISELRQGRRARGRGPGKRLTYDPTDLGRNTAAGAIRRRLRSGAGASGAHQAAVDRGRGRRRSTARRRCLQGEPLAPAARMPEKDGAQRDQEGDGMVLNG